MLNFLNSIPSGCGKASIAVKQWGAVVIERPRRRDYWMVAFLLALQAVLLLCSAFVSSVIVKAAAAGSDTVNGDAVTGNPGVLGFFVHNALVFLAWSVGGMASFGLISMVFAGFSTLYDGFIIGAAIQVHGGGQLFFLGHGLLEVPAFAIGLYLGIRPLLLLFRLKRGKELKFVREMFSGVALWLACGLALLFGAAAWEAAVEVPAAAG